MTRKLAKGKFWLKASEEQVSAYKHIKDIENIYTKNEHMTDSIL